MSLETEYRVFANKKRSQSMAFLRTVKKMSDFRTIADHFYDFSNRQCQNRVKKYKYSCGRKKRSTRQRRKRGRNRRKEQVSRRLEQLAKFGSGKRIVGKCLWHLRGINNFQRAIIFFLNGIISHTRDRSKRTFWQGNKLITPATRFSGMIRYRLC